MSEEYGADFITITDEDGNEFELEHLDTLEYNGETYMAFFPTVEDGKDVEEVDLDEEYGLIILKVVEENGEEQLSTLDSDEELELVYQQFMEQLFADEEDDRLFYFDMEKPFPAIKAGDRLRVTYHDRAVAQLEKL